MSERESIPDEPDRILIFLLAAATLLAQLARVLGVPYPILLVLGGLGISFVPGFLDVEISPDVIFIVFLPPLLNAARESYEGRIGRYEAGIEAGGPTEEYARSSGAWRNGRRALLSAEREAILRLRDEGKIGPEVMRRIERELDLEESRIGG